MSNNGVVGPVFRPVCLRPCLLGLRQVFRVRECSVILSSGVPPSGHVAFAPVDLARFRVVVSGLWRLRRSLAGP
jgi:hypothetical protein